LGFLIFLLAALAIGAAATFIAAPAIAPASGGTSNLSASTNSLIAGILALVTLGAFAAWIGVFVYGRVTGTSMGFPQRTLVFVLVVFLLLGVFLVLSHFANGSAIMPRGNPGNNSHPGSPPPSPGNPAAQNNSTGLGTFSGWGVHLPGWWVYAALLAGGVVVGVFAIPFLLRARPNGPSSAGKEDLSTLRETITEAINRLREGTQRTPRELIVLTYARLLERVVVGVGNVSILTPREIEELCVERLRMRRGTATALTSLFEEARYSTHPMGIEAVTRAESALRVALADLDAGGPLGVRA
jgi:hypothetical protein